MCAIHRIYFINTQQPARLMPLRFKLAITTENIVFVKKCTFLYDKEFE